MKISRLVFAAAALLLVHSAAHAGLLELRAGAGMNSASPDAFEDEVNAAGGGGLESDDFDNFNADVFFNIPAFPIGVGLRHEWINQKQSANGSEWDLKAQNTSVLVDWRIIDTVAYVGPIVSIGYPTADVDFETGGLSFSDRVKSGKPSYSLGAEAGVKLAFFILGAEAGYQSIELDEYKTGSGSDVNIDLSGFYGKVMIGLSFL